jgi:hypothetical protein
MRGEKSTLFTSAGRRFTADAVEGLHLRFEATAAR